MPNPVTIVIPTFNRINLLKRAIQSVLKQNVPLTLHILDNGSTDGTGHYLKNLQKLHSNLILTLRETNVGVITNYLDGLNSVTTDYLVPLADDDELADGFLEQALEIAKQDSSLAAVIFSTEVRRQNQKVDEYTTPSRLLGKQSPQEHLRQFLRQGHYTGWSSILWKTTAINELDLMYACHHFGPPTDVWIQFCVFSKYPVFITNAPGSIFHIHGNQITSTLGLNPEFMTQIGRLIQYIYATLNSKSIFSKDELTLVMRDYSKWLNKDLCSKSIPANLSSELVFEMISIYLKDFYPFVGFTDSPLIPLLTKLNQETGPTTHSPHRKKLNIIFKLIKQLTPPIFLPVLKGMRGIISPRPTC